MQTFWAYAVAGGILLLVADVAPNVAAATTGLILLGVAMSHSNQLTAISQFVSSNTAGGKTS